MRVKCFHLGAYGTNCFLAYDENNIAYFFDCGGRNLDKVYDFIREHNLNLKYIVLTHGHGDHIEGLNDLASHYPEAKVYIGEEDKDFYIIQNLVYQIEYLENFLNLKEKFIQ